MCFLIWLIWQDPQVMEPEPINAHVFQENGKKLVLVDVKIKGTDPYVFEFNAQGETALVSLLRVSRITKLDAKMFEVLFDDGKTQRGRINAFDLVGRLVNDPKEEELFYNIYHLDRVHIISGNQLRSCFEGHYEAYTPYPFCPVCGKELAIGPYMEELDDKKRPRPKEHILRLDPRNPSSSNN